MSIKRRYPTVLDEAALARLREIQAFLLDMDGTVYLGDRLLPGSRSFFDLVREQGRRLMFVTNNNTRDRGEYSGKLRRLGIEASKEMIYTSGAATADYLTSRGGRPRVFVLGTPSFEREIADAGIEVVKGPSETPGAVDYVVLGFDMTLTYEKLRIACRLIDLGARFVASHPDRVCPTPEGPIPDCGAMIALIQTATGVSPKIVGKPYPEMVQGALGRLGASGPRVAMVGDRLYTDMQMAHDAGVTSILVLCGEATLADLESCELEPDFVVESLQTIVDCLSGK